MTSTIDGESAHARAALAAETPDARSADVAPGAESLAAPPGDVVQAWLCLLPALALAWPGPGALLRDDFVPHSTGIGAAALLSIPAIAWLIARKAAPAVRGLALFLVPLLISVGWISFGGVSDTFESARALLFAINGLVMLLCGASLGRDGRRTLARGAVCVSLALLLPAHFDRDGGWSGVLGNTGSTSESALAGAAVGACLLARETKLWRVLGGAALGLELAYVARVPVIAGALSLAAALACVALFASAIERRSRVVLAAIACAAAAVAVLPVARAPSAPPAAASARSASAVDPGDAGGIEVRARIWRAAVDMLGEHPLFGVGPGQFAVWFPAHRDPREIELSTLSRRSGTETEVEHPHNDWLAVWLETGVAGGVGWLAFALLVVASAIGALRAGDAAALPFAAASIALLANAFVHATLSADAVSSTLACAAFGCVLARTSGARAPLSRRFVVVSTAALLLVHAPRALAFVRHGRALHALATRAATDPAVVERALDKALDACPDSVLALSLRARELESEHREPSAVREQWARVLFARPQRIEALMQLGLSWARADDPAEARPYYLAALALDPGHPGLLQNLATLEFDDGNIAMALDYLDRLSRIRPPAPQELADFAARLYLRGREAESDALMQRGEPKLASLAPDAAYAAAKEYRRAGRATLADALESRAHRTWAREHMRAGRFADAVRSYRQDLRIARDYADGGPLRPRLELAAALLAAGRESEARQEIDDLQPGARDWSALPDFARERLRATSWFPK